MRKMKKAAALVTAITAMALIGVAEPEQAHAETWMLYTTEGQDPVRTVPHYELKNGGTWNGTQYVLSDGRLATECFFCDGEYTYYLQNDGTPMKDRLTYHPDGIHIIYFDSQGHEVFSDFANVKKSIAGDPVDDLCFFNVYGYMYVDQLTYDKAGVNLYYANPYGVMERNGWFYFSSNCGGGIGYAYPDGRLAKDEYVSDQNGSQVYVAGNGHVEGTVGMGTDTSQMTDSSGNPIASDLSQFIDWGSTLIWW